MEQEYQKHKEKQEFLQTRKQRKNLKKQPNFEEDEDCYITEIRNEQPKNLLERKEQLNMKIEHCEREYQKMIQMQ